MGIHDKMKANSRTRCQEIHPGIYRITLPLPGKKPGPVNVYLFTGKIVTLLDTGTLKSVNVLERALAELDITFFDIDQIVLTHGHIDHYGAARKIVKKSFKTAKVLAHEEDRILIEHGLEVSLREFISYYRLMGVPLIFQLSLVFLLFVLNSMAENCPVDRFLSDGEKIGIGDYEATVITTPGHTRGSICFYLEKDGILFPGDHILGHITPNAFVMLETDFVLPRRMSQVEFYESLEKIEKIAPRIVYPAHGKPIDDIGKTIALFRDQFLLRQKNIISILRDGEFTVYQIGRKLFPEIRGKRLPLEVFLAVSEVYTHLQVLQKAKKVVSHLKKRAMHYRLFI
jgi:glyoxylase-like metal-dependent hydrolase (beta-lactamase superfamily II)